MAAKRRPKKKAAKPAKPLRKKFERKLAAAAPRITSRARANPPSELVVVETAKRKPPRWRSPPRDNEAPFEESIEPLPPPPAADSEPAERIDYIVQIMARVEWDGYLTRVELAKAWGVTDETVRRYAAEANRRFELDEDEKKQAQLQASLSFQKLHLQALTTFNEQTGMPDFGNAIKARELAVKYQGVVVDEPKKRVELTGKDGGPIEHRGPTIMIPPEIEE